MGSEAFGIKKEAIWAVCNAACIKDFDVIKKILNLGALPMIVNGLYHNDYDLLLTILAALKNIFEVVWQSCGLYSWDEFLNEFQELNGFEKLEQLLDHSNPVINKKAENIISSYNQTEKWPLIRNDVPLHFFS